MIGRIHGRLVSKQPPQLLVDVGGVGYEIEAPMSTFYNLPAVGETVTLHTHLTVREDAHLLFGFGSQAEKSLFRELIKVSGVGPKLALAVLSGVGVEEFWDSARNGDAARLTKLPGVGRKTADRLIVEMRDRAGGFTDSPVGFNGVAVPSSPLQDAKHALAALGYKPAEIQRLTDAVHREDMSTEQIIQEALRRAVR
ncbi:Holliday junction branch migration protein RuvA [Sinimarinibacterium sp. CAU 1509]|uniref:Holliday junction branch migration protein RuvA n=1 Tax=Sinimarinibacterium sp. CAU 1509 TaxID=2562283 RepID=UPI0010AD46D7|nr:Holliday junction branch migration protein RuvA [Sinimarinibacterium sp. CAU 1509]TJY60837.1 Holliday junction branch migration protein RuvA [Sinimarinibacterium sp. CAU 1509]